MRLLFLLLFLWSGPLQAETVNLKMLMDQFNAVVFVHEHGKTGAEATPLVKWKKRVLFSPSGTLTQAQVKKLFGVLERVRRLTKLDMRMVVKGEKPDLIIHFVPKDELAKKMAKGINCFGKIGANDKYEIIRGNAYIPSDRPDKTDHCTVEETVQLFGLMNDSTLIKNSMFHEQSTRTSMSVTDQILLKALYDPRLKPGMTKEQAQPVLRQVMLDILSKAKKKK